jgi:hypothetical protein
MCENDDDFNLVNRILELLNLSGLILYAYTPESRRDFKEKLVEILQMLNDEDAYSS